MYLLLMIIASEVTSENMLSLLGQAIWWIVGCLGWFLLRLNGGQPERDGQ